MVDVEMEDDVDKAFKDYKPHKLEEDKNIYLLTALLAFLVILFAFITFYYENFSLTVPSAILVFSFFILSIVTFITIFIVKQLKDLVFPFLLVFTYLVFLEFFNIVLLHSFLFCCLGGWIIVSAILIMFKLLRKPGLEPKSISVATIT